ncbi:MAG: rhodanese-like domain-containing protein [Dehalococcoidia bacterium]|jgi:rhodanese-related sulfurtransferase|nr:rhodanese-like domain-containing protein [Dehalococcoidia bacterium]
MAEMTSPAALSILLDGNSQFALIDVREAGEYNSSHIPGSSLISRRQLEFRMQAAAPFQGASLVICDDDGRRAELAGATLEGMGYTRVSILEGGINRWTTQGYPTQWGTNVPSKDLGEMLEVVHQVPEIEATDLHQRIERGDKLVILDTRTPEEYQRFCIPGGRSVPGGELALRITDIMKDLEPDTTVIVNCAGRTRSIVGTRVLQRMGLSNIQGLKNGTSGWVLAGYEVERGAHQVQLPEPSPEGLAAAEGYAALLAAEDGVRYLDIPALKATLGRRGRETIYLVDVRTREEYEAGHIPGFLWFPGGQALQRSDELAVVHNSTFVFACDGKARATFAASWYRQLRIQEAYAVDGGIAAWAAAGLALEKGMPEEPPHLLAEARSSVRLVSPRELQQDPPPVVIFVDTSQDFAQGHVAGAGWAPRGSLELQVGDFAPSKEAAIGVTCSDGRASTLAGATLKELGYRDVSVLEGGMQAWRQDGLPVETGLAGVMTSPTDVVILGVDRNPADMMHYLRWETALGDKYQAKGD